MDSFGTEVGFVVGNYERERHAVFERREQVKTYKELMADVWKADVAKFIKERTGAFGSRLKLSTSDLVGFEAKRIHNEKSKLVGFIVQFLECYYDAIVRPCATCLETSDSPCPHVSAEEMSLFWKLGSTCSSAYEAVKMFLVNKNVVLTARTPFDSSGATLDGHPGKIHPQSSVSLRSLNVSTFLSNARLDIASPSLFPYPSMDSTSKTAGSCLPAYFGRFPIEKSHETEPIEACRCASTKWLFFLTSVASSFGISIQFPPPTDSFKLELYGIVLVPEDQEELLKKAFGVLSEKERLPVSTTCDAESRGDGSVGEEEEEEGDVDEDEEKDEEAGDPSFSTPKKWKRRRAGEPFLF